VLALACIEKIQSCIFAPHHTFSSMGQYRNDPLLRTGRHRERTRHDHLQDDLHSCRSTTITTELLFLVNKYQTRRLRITGRTKLA